MDDSEVARSLLASRLVEGGASVVCAASAKDALAVDAETFSAAIIDVDLGDGDGVSLADVLAGRNPRLRLALFTSDDDPPRSERTTFHKPAEIDRVVAWALER